MRCVIPTEGTAAGFPPYPCAWPAAQRRPKATLSFPNDIKFHLTLNPIYIYCSRRREHLRAIAIQIAAVTAFSEA